MVSVNYLAKKAQLFIDPKLDPESGPDPHNHQAPSYGELTNILGRFGAEPILNARNDLKSVTLTIPNEFAPMYAERPFPGLSVGNLFRRTYGEPITVREGLGPANVQEGLGLTNALKQVYFPSRAFGFSEDPIESYANYLSNQYTRPQNLNIAAHEPGWRYLTTSLSRTGISPFSQYGTSSILMPKEYLSYDKRDILRQLGELMARRQAKYLMETMAPNRAMVSVGPSNPPNPLARGVQGITLRENRPGADMLNHIWVDSRLSAPYAGWSGTMIHEGAHTYFPQSWVNDLGRKAMDVGVPVVEGATTMYERAHLFNLLREIADDESVDPKLRATARDIYERSFVPLPTGHVIPAKAMSESFNYLFRGNDTETDPAKRFQQVFLKRPEDMIPAAMSFVYPMIYSELDGEIAKDYLNAIDYFERNNQRIANVLKHNYMYNVLGPIKGLGDIPDRMQGLIDKLPIFVPSRSISAREAAGNIVHGNTSALTPMYNHYYRVDDPTLKRAYINFVLNPPEEFTRRIVETDDDIPFPGLDVLPEDLRKAIINHAMSRR